MRKTAREGGDDMPNLVMSGQAATGLRVSIMGLAALWFAAIYQDKQR
ncbi:MAG: hypothetical protein QNL88_02605 [Acidobacteriota bacterium]|nr:hypothetical protein [Acidobacteriota bacterium]